MKLLYLKQKEEIMPYKDPNKRKEYSKVFNEIHREELRAYYKNWKETHKEEIKNYAKNFIANDLNSLGQTKHNIRQKSQYYLIKYGQRIDGYEIHHCFTYDEPYKFIYCPRKLHRLIHAYLKQHNIDV